jgi:hypothetical protein
MERPSEVILHSLGVAWDAFFFSGIALPFCVFLSFAGSLPLPISESQMV